MTQKYSKQALGLKNLKGANCPERPLADFSATRSFGHKKTLTT